MRSSDSASFTVANLFVATPETIAALGRIDRALIDPPREGAVELAKSLPHRATTSALKRIVYVSCNPATLARDAAVLVHERGYRLTRRRHRQHVSAHGARRVDGGIRPMKNGALPCGERPVQLRGCVVSRAAR